jgi:colanic acid biosynthesis protein WcaH
MTISDAVQFLDNNIPDKWNGLPNDIFYFISRITPLVCVDLLVKDTNGRCLLAWRDDEYHGKGWHIPGGIVQFQETLEQRIQKTAELEYGVNVQFSSVPLTVEQLIIPENENRGHFITFLYKCSVPDNFIPDNQGRKEDDAGYLKWHETCPFNLIKIQDYCRKFIG